MNNALQASSYTVKSFNHHLILSTLFFRIKRPSTITGLDWTGGLDWWTDTNNHFYAFQ